MKNKEKNGYVALISLIIIGAIVLILALAITFITLSQSQNMIGQNQGIRSYYLANACAHYAINKLQDNDAYSGNETIEIENESCRVEQVLGSGNLNRTIITSSTVVGRISKLEIIISQLKPKTIIRSWQEIY